MNFKFCPEIFVVHPNLLKILMMLSCAVFVGCTSLVEKGEKAFKNEEYEVSIGFFEKALVEDKEDLKALSGLRKSREAWLSRRLIDARLLRLSGDSKTSFSTLLEVLNKSREWGVVLRGAAFSTQSEETEFHYQVGRDKILKSIQKDNPILAEVVYRAYIPFLELSPNKMFLQLKIEIKDAAQKFCTASTRALSRDDYFTSQWIIQTCRVWKIDPKFQQIPQPTVQLFGKLNTEVIIENLDSNSQGMFKDSVEKAFRNTLWYQPVSTVAMNLSVKGLLRSIQSETPVERTAEYNSEELRVTRYTQRVKSSDNQSSPSSAEDSTDQAFKLVALPFDVAGLLLSGFNNSSNQLSQPVTVSDDVESRQGDIETRVKKERVPIKKTFRYKATEMKAEKFLSLELFFNVNGKTLSFPLQESYSFKADRHDESFADAGVAPSRPQFVSDESWLNSISSLLVNKVTAGLEKGWVSAFCVQNQNLQSNEVDKIPVVTEQEYAHRCAYMVKSDVPAYLSQYYLKHWQVDYLDWKNLTANQF